MNTISIKAAGRGRFVTLAGAIIVCSIVFYRAPLGSQIETDWGLAALYSVRDRLRPISPPSGVALVKLDDGAAKSLGPGVEVERWPRTLHACLIEHLARLKPALIVFDIYFSDTEATESSSLSPASPAAYDETVAAACELREGAAASQQLGEAIRSAGNVLLVSRLEQSDSIAAQRVGQTVTESMPDPRVAEGALGSAPLVLPDSSQRVNQFWTWYPLPMGSGHPPREIPTLAALNPREVRDIERRIGPQGLARPSAPAIVSGKLRGSMEQIRAAAASDPTSRRLINAAGAWAANLFLGPADRVFNIYGPPDSLQTFDYLKILQTDKDGSLAAQIRDKVIFVGAAEHHTNSGIDRYFTPYPAPPGKKYGGVELVAMAFANVRDGTTLRQLNVGQGAALLGLIGLVVMAAGWRWEPQRALPAIALLATGYSAAVYFAFVAMHVWLPLVTPLLLEIPLLTFGALLLQYFHSRAAWREIFAIAQKYVPFEASKFLSELEQRRHANDPVFGTILSSDAANFTKVVEGFGPELPRLVELLDEYFSALSGPVEASIPKGMIIDTAGDGMLAVWQDPDDSLAARRAACIAACAIRAAVEAFNRAHPNTPLPTRLGLHAGNLALADVMAGPRAFYKAIGDVPNTASRIEALNKRLGTSLLASGPVVVGLEDLLLIRPCGRFKLPGKQDALEIVEILGLREQALPTQSALLAKFEAALHLVEAQQWPQAAAAFTAVLAEFPGDGPSEFYRAWCEKKHPAREIDTDSSIIVIDTK